MNNIIIGNCCDVNYWSIIIITIWWNDQIGRDLLKMTILKEIIIGWWYEEMMTEETIMKPWNNERNDGQMKNDK